MPASSPRGAAGKSQGGCTPEARKPVEGVEDGRQEEILDTLACGERDG